MGARPNLMKVMPIIQVLNKYLGGFEHLLVHTWQYYDQRMSMAFFDDLGMPKPDIDSYSYFEVRVWENSNKVKTSSILERSGNVNQYI